MQPSDYPAGLSELEFLEAYYSSGLRKPSVVADSVLRSLVLAGQSDRLVLSGLVAEQLAEACRRLCAVYLALSDRRHPIARTLMGPLPREDEWVTFAQHAATFTPEQMLRELSLDDSALEAAKKLRGLGDLGELAPLVAAAESGNPMFLVPSLPSGRTPIAGWLRGTNGDGEATVVEVLLEEHEVASLADLTAELTGIARRFLGAYLEARRTAGRR
jgi:hypothetical protein